MPVVMMVTLVPFKDGGNDRIEEKQEMVTILELAESSGAAVR